MTTVRFLSAADLQGLATAREMVDAVREAYRDHGTGAPTAPRFRFQREDPPGFLTGYHGILPTVGAMGGYLYSAGFAARDAWFLLTLFDARTGEPRAILDGGGVNPWKTGAAGGVAADSLARRDASVAAIIGSGAQARGQLRALAAVRDLDAVRVYSPTTGHREAFAAAMAAELGVDVTAVRSAGEAARGADVVVTATKSPRPVVEDAAIEAGCHVTAMGQYHPERSELEAATVARALYVPDLRERALQDSGELLGAVRAGLVPDAAGHVHGSLGEVVAGKVPGRTDEDQLTLFDSGGTAIETLAAGALLLQRAEERGLGTLLEVAPASVAMER